MFTLKIFTDPRPCLGCALSSLGQSLARVRIGGSAPLRAESQKCSLSKSPLGCVNRSTYNFFVSGPKFTKFLKPPWDGCSWSDAVQIFDICRSVPEIFATKVESCQKSRQIVDVFFAHQILLGATLPKFVSTLSLTPASRHVVWLVKFPEITPIIPKVISIRMLILKPNFKYSPLTFLGWPRPGFWYTLASLGERLWRVKIWVATTT